MYICKYVLEIDKRLCFGGWQAEEGKVHYVEGSRMSQMLDW